MSFRAFISGCAGPELCEEERAFFAAVRPSGLILFARNCVTPEQVRSLVASFREAVESEEALVLVDQEGGRVQRLKPPHWRQMLPARRYGELYDVNPEAAKAACFAGARLIAAELAGLDIDVNCAPVLDVPQPGAHDIIGDRAFASDPDVVTALGRAAIEGYLAGGVLPVIKHVPGQGRAKVDSHFSLPVIEATKAELESVDFRPFQALADAPLAMTAHVLLSCFDDRRPASVSHIIMQQVIRDLIGIKGLVMSDDIGMQALGGALAVRAREAVAAGCDVALHCSGNLAEMREVADAVLPLSGESAERFARARGRLRAPEAFDSAGAVALLSDLGGNARPRAEL
jgi:beta-N-acetylhexosaminidase